MNVNMYNLFIKANKQFEEKIDVYEFHHRVNVTNLSELYNGLANL
jgi:hypothetical protein